ncbi:MAG: hypothetical protein WCA06_03175 [Terrimicrobiaceae bacterium]
MPAWHAASRKQRIRLKRAVELDKQFQKVAIDDEDLRPLWDWIADLA